MRKLVAILLNLFPASFRGRFGTDMLSAFDDLWQERPGVSSAARTVSNLVASAAIEQFHFPGRKRGDTPMVVLWNDIRFALRLMIVRPGFAAIVALTLAVGIGASTAIFSVVDAVLLRPLPFRDADRLVRVVDNAPGAGLHDTGMSVPEYWDLRDRSGVFDEISVTWPVDANLTGGDRPERIELLAVSPNYFHMLGAKPALGRVIGSEDTAQGFAEAVVISDGLWQRLFGRDPNVLGRKVLADSDAYYVVGVMPPGFRHPGRTVATDVEIWCTAGFAADPFPNPPVRASNALPGAIGRLKQGMTLKEAQARLDSFTAELRRQYPHDYRPGAKWSVELEPLQESLVGRSRPLLLILLGAVVLMLLTACVNVANLLLTRGADRQREVAIRRALGASQSRILSQLFTESILLGVTGGLLGILGAVATLKSVLAIAPAGIPRLNEVTIDARVLGFALLASVVTGVLFGLVPALDAAGVRMFTTLRSRNQNRVGGWLVTSEIAICMVLMMGAGLLSRSFWKVAESDPGFNPARVLVARFWLAQPNNPRADPYAKPADRTVLLREILRRVRELPGVEEAAVTTSAPLTNPGFNVPITVEGNTSPGGEGLRASMVSASPDYFSALGTPLLDGRFLAESDQSGSQEVVIVDRAAARKFFPGEASPIGRRFLIGRTGDRWVTVVGMVGDIRHDGLDLDGVPHIYPSIYQRSGKAFGVVIRTSSNPAALSEILAKTVGSVDNQVPVFGVRPMSALMAKSMAERRFSAYLVACLAGFSLLLAGMGIYGILSFSVGRRTREIGVRMALGAHRSEVILMILRQGLQMILAGLAFGVLGAMAFSRLLGRLLFGIGPWDPAVFAVVPLTFLVVALAASYLPALRATRIDPASALRAE